MEILVALGYAWAIVMTGLGLMILVIAMFTAFKDPMNKW